MFLKEFSSTVLQREFPVVADAIKKQPVAIMRHGKTTAVVMSKDHYADLVRKAEGKK